MSDHPKVLFLRRRRTRAPERGRPRRFRILEGDHALADFYLGPDRTAQVFLANAPEEAICSIDFGAAVEVDEEGGPDDPRA